MMKSIVLIVALAGSVKANEYDLVKNPQFVGVKQEKVELTASLWEQVPLRKEIPTGFPNLPSGCVCVNEEQDSAGCTSFACNQTCNLNVGVCDAYCCSDPDCTSEEIARFVSTGKCMDEEDAMRVTRCSDTSTLLLVNEKYNMFVEQDDDPLAGFLCVSILNSPYEGEFFEPQTTNINNVALLDDPANKPEHSFQQEPADTTGLDFYVQGDALRAAVSKDGSLGMIWGGYLSLPTSGPDGSCVESNYVGFAETVETNACVRPIQHLESQCLDGFSPLSTTWLLDSTLQVGSNPLVSINDRSGNAWIAVQAMHFVHQSASGQETTVDTAVTTWNNDTQTCMNALRGVEYTISYTTEGLVSAVTAKVLVMDLAASELEKTREGGLMQHFLANFVNTNTVSSQNAQVNRVVSGNPGYIIGLPVQAGNLTGTGSSEDGTDKLAVEYYRKGLQMMMASGPKGECTEETKSWLTALKDQRNTKTTPILFGVDTSSTCSVKLSLEDFQGVSSWCQDFSTLPLFNIDATVVGIYGNADPLKAWEWVPMKKDVSNLVATKPAPAPGLLACQGVVDTLNIEILWTKSGQKHNPQRMILGARAVYGQSDWAWKKGFQSNSSQTFYFTQTVTFVEYNIDDKTSFYKPDIAPIIPQLPSDIFYPFDIVSAAPRHSAVNCFVLLAALLLICFNTYM